MVYAAFEFGPFKTRAFKTVGFKFKKRVLVCP